MKDNVGVVIVVFIFGVIAGCAFGVSVLDGIIEDSYKNNLIENNIIEYKTDKFGKTYIVPTDSIYSGIAKYYGGESEE